MQSSMRCPRKLGFRKKYMFVHASVNIKHQTLGMIVAAASIFNYDLWFQDVSKAYLQSEELLNRDVYVFPKQGFIQKL